MITNVLEISCLEKNGSMESAGKKKKKRLAKSERRRRKRERESQSSTLTVSNGTKDIHESPSPLQKIELKTHSENSNIHESKIECSPLQQKMLLRDIQFVYPTSSMSTPSTPYVFAQLRQETSLSSEASTSYTLDANTFNLTSTNTYIQESIEDILDLKRKTKMEDAANIIPENNINTPKIHQDEKRDETLNHSEPNEPCQDLIMTRILVESSKDNKNNNLSHKPLHRKDEPLLNQQQGNSHRPLSGRTMDDAVRDTIGKCLTCLILTRRKPIQDIYI